MRTLYVVTHPEATHHVEGVVGGWHDSELTAAGTRAAARAARALRSRIPPEAEVELYSSDLRRCRQTAEAVASLLGLRPVWDPRLREKSYGEARAGRRRGWTGASSRPRPPGNGWTTTRAYRARRPRRPVPGASTRPWTTS